MGYPHVNGRVNYQNLVKMIIETSVKFVIQTLQIKCDMKPESINARFGFIGEEKMVP